MTIFRYIVTVFITLLLAVASSSARNITASRHFSSKNGLSNDFVISMAIDGMGYIWVGTEAGVSRISGIYCEPFLKSELAYEQRISSLYWHDQSGQMLIGTERGLCIYKPSSGVIQELTKNNGLVPSSVACITPVSKSANQLWIVYGNGEVQKLNMSTNEVTNQKLPQSHFNRCGLDDGHGHLYLGHNQHGMSIINLINGKVTNYQYQPDDTTSLPGNNVRIIYKDSHQRIWVGTDNGLALFHPETATFTKVMHLGKFFEDNVFDIKEMRDGSLWVACDMGGIKIVNTQDIRHYAPTKVTLSSVNTRCIALDEFDNLWIGNHSTGVDFISRLKSDFNLLEYTGKERLYRPVFAIAPDGKGIWTASEDELAFWENHQQKDQWSFRSLMRKEMVFTRCLMVDSKGYIWMGIDDQGVFRVEKKSKHLEQIPISTEATDIHTFMEDDKGRIWISGESNVWIYENGHTMRHDYLSKTLRAPATYMMHLENGQLLIATLGDGIYTFDLKANTHRHLSTNNGLPSSKINQVILDHNKGLWMATNGGLVYLENPSKLEGIKVYGKSNGLSNIHVLALQQAEDGHIWMSTYSGISCLVEETEKIYNYNHPNTLQPGSFSFGASSTDTFGTIYFGSASGVCYFHPQQMDSHLQMSNVQIITCEAYNPIGSHTEIQRLTPDEDNRIYTTYQQNTLRLTFTVRNFAQTEHVDYSYMMKGLDDKWYEIGNEYNVIFRGLHPGHYTFILRAKLKSQDWEDAKDTCLEIIIAPPFWHTWWAYLIYALTIVSLVWYLIRSYKRRLKLRNSLELAKQENLQKQELNEERLRFFTNVTHELRTPLTLILGPLEDLISDQQLPPANKKKVQMIHKSAKQLRNLINSILEFRKTETQNRRLTVAKGNIGSFIRDICLNYKELIRNPKVQFRYEIATDLPDIYFDSEVINTVMNNFLSNAIKYTEQGNIMVSVGQLDDSRIEISVTDTGYGIAAKALPHIFERYYQADGQHQASGTGIGLALVKSLTNLHEAQLLAESKEGKGSKFSMLLDINNTYPNALHKEDLEEPKANELADSEDVDEEDSQVKLLVVEDNDDIRQYIADSFEDDYRILQATNGEEGLSLALEQMPDIIVSDIMMPRMNGIELTRQLKEDIRTSHIPIILLTAKDTDEDKEEGYDSGADSYLTKPFTAKLLGSRIRNLLTSRRRLAEQLPNLLQPLPTIEASSDTSNDTSLLSNLDREFLNRLNQLIDDNIKKEEIDLAFVTDKMAMSHSTFYRKVKALTGLTAQAYIRKRRLRYSYQLLASGDYNVSQAAMMTGFNQMAHFRETFKKEFGILPSEVRKNK